ncbi:MAG: T9SS type A sorting domain-containing protein [Ignavibacteria bacterium]|nr:T9SS type A sorting domain-containing protein [Ignavibacteria bacterium]
MRLQKWMLRTLVALALPILGNPSLVQGQSLRAGAVEGQIIKTYVNADGVEYRFGELIRPDNHNEIGSQSAGQTTTSRAVVCSAVGGMVVRTSPSGGDTLVFRFTPDGTRIDSVYFVFHNLCGFTRLEVKSSSSPGQVIDPQTCRALWTMTCITNIVAGHRITFDLNARSVIDSVRSTSSCSATCAARQFSYSVTDVEFQNPTVPKTIVLEQNYPNPFNPLTAISYELPANGFVMLTVSDVLGKEVATLVNEQCPAGTHRVTWDASSKPSGVYFYRLQSRDFIQVKRMILMK